VREVKAHGRQVINKPLEWCLLLTALGRHRQRWTMLQQAERRQRANNWVADPTRQGLHEKHMLRHGRIAGSQAMPQ
jgi:hypothetical protein